MRYLSPLLLIALLASTQASGTIYTVNSEADVSDDNLGDNICHAELGLPGVCTLRAAIQEANAHPGADTINLTAGQTYTLTRSGQDANAGSGDLDITDNLTIAFFSSGVRPVVDANGLERAFEIHSGNVTMLGFDITGGDATLPGDVAGGAVAVNFNAGSVFLSLMRMYGNRANFGGALYNDGADTTLIASELHDNQHVTGFADSSSSAIRNRGTPKARRSASAKYSMRAANASKPDPGTGFRVRPAVKPQAAPE